MTRTFAAVLALLLSAACASALDDSATAASPSSGSGGASLDPVGGAGGGDEFENADDAPVCDAVDLNDLGVEKALRPCEEEAPPEAFEPKLEWSFGQVGETAARGTQTIPLVGNLTDDNDDGVIDLCDTPDVVLLHSTASNGGLQGFGYSGCALSVLDGATGKEHYRLEGPEHNLACVVNPAIGDINGDGKMNIVVAYDADPGDELDIRLRAYDHQGNKMWDGPPFDGLQLGFGGRSRASGPITLADLDGDGTGEVLFAHEVYSSTGELIWKRSAEWFVWVTFFQIPIAADLDGDGDREVIYGHAAYDFAKNGSEWQVSPVYSHWGPSQDDVITSPSTSAHVAEFIPEPGPARPEIVVATGKGLFLLEHDGTVIWGPVKVDDPDAPLPCSESYTRARPGALKDLDGDGRPELLIGQCDQYVAVKIVEAGPEVLWGTPINDIEGASSGTAFDFLGDGGPEAIYSDESSAYAFSSVLDNTTQKWTAEAAFAIDRISGTSIEYPVVADIDNDGSAEFLVVSNDTSKPALQAFGEVESRWVGARRIWNQHAYRITDVHEDGRLPKTSLPEANALNNFRVNLQHEKGALCEPIK